jgi:hypothetical protein
VGRVSIVVIVTGNATMIAQVQSRMHGVGDVMALVQWRLHKGE